MGGGTRCSLNRRAYTAPVSADALSVAQYREIIRREIICGTETHHLPLWSSIDKHLRSALAMTNHLAT